MTFEYTVAKKEKYHDGMSMNRILLRTSVTHGYEYSEIAKLKVKRIQLEYALFMPQPSALVTWSNRPYP